MQRKGSFPTFSPQGDGNLRDSSRSKWRELSSSLSLPFPRKGTETSLF
ncbi:hypothetical protein CKA32_006184 [Geitlerinema sp. FC II]|nr:hypothetical protein CKA32_006184 [Geitlerinema sp. FC II]